MAPEITLDKLEVCTANWFAMGERASIRTDEVHRLAALTERYARFSLSAAGLGNVVGGFLVLVTYLIGALTPPSSPWGRLALASAPLLWILTKELLRRRYYQRLGAVHQVWDRGDRRWHIALTVFSTLIALFVVGSVLFAARQEPGRLLEAGAVGYLIFIAALPFLTWKGRKLPP